MRNVFEKDELRAKINIPSYVPDFINERIDDTLNNLGGKKTRKKYAGKVAAAVLAACIGVTSLGTLVVFGKDLPFIKSIIEFVNPSAANKYDSLKVGVNKSAADKGITLTVNDMSYDGATLIVGCSINKAGGFDNDIIDMFMVPRLNGSKGTPICSSINSFLLREDKDNYKGYASFYLGDEKLPDEFKLFLAAEEVGGVRGSWVVETDVAKARIYVETDVKEYKETHKIDGGAVKYIKLLRSPLNNIVTIKGSYSASDTDIRNAFPRFIILDDKGNSLNYDIFNESVGTDKEFNSDIRIMNIPEGTKKLTVIPYKNTASKGKTYMADITKLPTSIKIQEKVINISSVECGEGMFSMRYTIDGLAEERYNTYFEFIDKHGKTVEVPPARVVPMDYNTGIGVFEFKTGKPQDIVKVGTYGRGYELMNNYKFDIEIE